MSKKNKYKFVYCILCGIAAVFFMAIGYQITTWQFWAGSLLIWSAAWCGMHMADEKEEFNAK